MPADTNAVYSFSVVAPSEVRLVTELKAGHGVDFVTGMVRNVSGERSFNGPYLKMDGVMSSKHGLSLAPGEKAPFTLGLVPLKAKISPGAHLFEFWGYDSVHKKYVKFDEFTVNFLPAEEPAEETGSIRVLSHPTDANILLDGAPTGKTTTAVVTASPGIHTIGLTKTGFRQFNKQIVILAGQSFQRTYTMKAIEEPPPVTPPEPPPVTPPDEPAFTPLGQLFQAFLGETPEWYKQFDDFMAWATDLFGIDFTAQMTTEDKALFAKFGLKDKILFFGGPMSTQQAVGTQTAQTLAGMTADDFVASAAKDPKGTLTAIKAVPKEELSKFFANIADPRLKLQVIQTVNRLILDARIQIPAWAKLSAVVGSAVGLYQISHTLNFLGFLGEEAIQTAGIGIFTLISEENWKEAAKSLPVYRNTVNAVIAQVDDLMKVPLLSFWLEKWWPQTKAATIQQIADYDATIKAGLAIEETGTIGITTTPTGASIFLDDTLQTYPSNTVLDKLVPGNYKITLDLEEHVAHEETVQVKEGEQTELQHEFVAIPEEPTPGSGQLQVAVYDYKTGNAIAGTLFINGIAEKYHLHSYALDLDPKTYEIKVEEIGYKPWEDTVAVTKGEVTKIRAEPEKLEEIPPEPPEPPPGLPPEPPLPTEKGTLEVNANVKAEIFIGGVETGKKTPSLIELTQGIYSVTVKAEGYISRSTTTLIKPGEKSVVFLELQKEDEPPPTKLLAKVSISSAPTSAKILVNGVWTNKYTPDSVLLKAGEYEIGLAKSGYKAWSTPLRLEEET